MFALFFSLYTAMFIGKWHMFTLGEMQSLLSPSVNELGEFITTIFGDVQMNNFGNTLFTNVTMYGNSYPPYVAIISLILAIITSIGIVVMAVKGIKRVFGIFFMPIR